MTQNIYDNDTFFARYGQLPRSLQGLPGAPEWPVLRGLLPRLDGRRVLDLGCGYGWFSRWARVHGAAFVLGVDVSARMLARAAAEKHDDAILYVRGDLETFAIAPGAFDLVYSSLALHYVEELAGLLRSVHAGLVSGGKLVFSVEHPILTAVANPSWFADAAGRDTWPVNGYLDEGARATDWLGAQVIKRHRTIETYFDLLVRSGFTVLRLIEWSPSPEQVTANPDWAKERERPFFLLIAATAVHALGSEGQKVD
ncbi:MAG TPA: class I SAM-dependent methyltransferase [Alphaproteobacteria bacterium]|nr:class I SAM-dependent methyltransferase [Alphaproteobacteria bacterium]